MTFPPKQKRITHFSEEAQLQAIFPSKYSALALLLNIFPGWSARVDLDKDQLVALRDCITEALSLEIVGETDEFLETGVDVKALIIAAKELRNSIQIPLAHLPQPHPQAEYTVNTRLLHNLVSLVPNQK